MPDLREIEKLLASLQEQFSHVAVKARRVKPDNVPMRPALAEAFDLLRQRYENQGAITGLASGFHDLDHLTSGLQNSDLIILAARPAMGKTMLALNIVESITLKSKKAVAVFSMDMSASQLTFRLISSMGRINLQRLKTGMLEDEDWSSVNTAIRTLSDAKLFIDDSSALSPLELAIRARQLKSDHSLGLIVVDNLQLMQVPGNKEGKGSEASVISRSLKALAKELNVPIIVLSQLNRDPETRTDKRPVMSDLSEYGGIEQDADVIMFLYRQEYYEEDDCPKNELGVSELIVAKHRRGQTDTIRLGFFGEYSRFENLARTDVG